MTSPSRHPLGRGLALRLAFYMLLLSMASTLCTSAYELVGQYRDTQAAMLVRLDEIGEANLKSLTNALWNVDERSVQLHLDGLRQLSDVERVEVVNAGQIVAGAGEVRSKDTLSRGYPLYFEFRNAPVLLGELHVVMGLDAQKERIREQAIRVVLAEALRTSILGLALFMIFYHTVGRHLRHMADYAAGLTVHGLKRSLELKRKPSLLRGEDELDQLSHSFETMRRNLAQSVDGLQEANDSLRQEISRRREAEDELLATRSYLRSIVDCMPSAIIGLSGDLHVTHWSATAARLTRLAPEQALGRPLDEVFPPLAEHADLVRLSISRRLPLTRQRLALPVYGGVIQADLMVYPLEAESVEGAVLRVDDVTDRARMEEVMVQSEKMASLGSLAAGMAHEINNPLAGVLQNAQSLQRRLFKGLPANEEAARLAGLDQNALEDYLGRREIPVLLQGVRSAGERAARIVRNMLKFSRQSVDAHEPQNLPEIVDAAVELAQSDYDMKKKYDFKRIRIERDYASDLPPVPCSAQEIEQVLLNLLKNAAQAMALREDDSREAVISLAVRQEGGAAVMVVRDNGPGMEEAVRRRVFEPFFTTKVLGEGTGLGLAVSYFIISNNHGGTITVASEPGYGAAFTIRIPLVPPFACG